MSGEKHEGFAAVEAGDTVAPLLVVDTTLPGEGAPAAPSPPATATGRLPASTTRPPTTPRQRSSRNLLSKTTPRRRVAQYATYPSPKPSTAKKQRRPSLDVGGVAKKARSSLARGSGGAADASVSADSRVRVVVRIRPPTGMPAGASAAADSAGRRASSDTAIEHDDQTISLNMGRSVVKNFTFDHVLGAAATQDDVYTHAAQDIAESALQGYNGCIFAYGQTGSGKTHTMQGMPTEGNPERGVVPRVLETVFSALPALEVAGWTFTVKCTCLEIYKEQISDLLATESPTAEGASSRRLLREHGQRGVFVEGLTELEVSSVESALDIVEAGLNQRTVSSTAMNSHSSRSHAVFTLLLQGSFKQDETGELLTRQARVNLVDLAGSERQKDTGATGARLKEAAAINKSLSTLGNVIKALSLGDASDAGHIRYRDSKLTFLLKDSLGGNTRTCMIAAVNPSRWTVGETLSTLQFAQRAKSIKNRARTNEVVSGNVREMAAEIKALRKQLAAAEKQQHSFRGSRMVISERAPATASDGVVLGTPPPAKRSRGESSALLALSPPSHGDMQFSPDTTTLLGEVSAISTAAPKQCDGAEAGRPSLTLSALKAKKRARCADDEENSDDHASSLTALQDTEELLFAILEKEEKSCSASVEMSKLLSSLREKCARLSTEAKLQQLSAASSSMTQRSGSGRRTTSSTSKHTSRRRKEPKENAPINLAVSGNRKGKRPPRSMTKVKNVVSALSALSPANTKNYKATAVPADSSASVSVFSVRSVNTGAAAATTVAPEAVEAPVAVGSDKAEPATATRSGVWPNMDDTKWRGPYGELTEAGGLTYGSLLRLYRQMRDSHKALLQRQKYAASKASSMESHVSEVSTLLERAAAKLEKKSREAVCSKLEAQQLRVQTTSLRDQVQLIKEVEDENRAQRSRIADLEAKVQEFQCDSASLRLQLQSAQAADRQSNDSDRIEELTKELQRALNDLTTSTSMNDALRKQVDELKQGSPAPDSPPRGAIHAVMKARSAVKLPGFMFALTNSIATQTDVADDEGGPKDSVGAPSVPDRCDVSCQATAATQSVSQQTKLAPTLVDCTSQTCAVQPPHAVNIEADPIDSTDQTQDGPSVVTDPLPKPSAMPDFSTVATPTTAEVSVPVMKPRTTGASCVLTMLDTLPETHAVKDDDVALSRPESIAIVSSAAEIGNGVDADSCASPRVASSSRRRSTRLSVSSTSSKSRVALRRSRRLSKMSDTITSREARRSSASLSKLPTAAPQGKKLSHYFATTANGGD